MSGQAPEAVEKGSDTSAQRDSRDGRAARRRAAEREREHVQRSRARSAPARPVFVYFDSPACAATCGTGRCTTRRPASTKSAGSQRCAPSKSGVIASTRAKRVASGRPAADRRDRAPAARPGSGARGWRPRTPIRRANGSSPPGADAAGEVGVAERGEQRRELGGRTLQVGVERRDQRRRGGAEAGDQRRRLAAACRETQRPHARVAPRRGAASSCGVSSSLPSSTTMSSQARPVGSSAARTSASRRSRFGASSYAGTTTLNPGVGDEEPRLIESGEGMTGTMTAT